MEMSKRDQLRIARIMAGLGVFITGDIVALASTYDCIGRELIGVHGCIVLGIILVWLAGWMTFGGMHGID